jgi:FKBP-type peptidyl-prolyl cis-trans isomerase 2
MKTKEKDFIEIDYLGKIKETGEIFDFTQEKEAKNLKVYNPKGEYKPLIICLGKRNVVQGLDEQLIGKEPGKEYTIEVPPEKAFGNKNPKLMKIVSTNLFLKQKINPVPGLQINLGNLIGTIRTVTGGRTIIDLNHPLAGKTLIYRVKINRIIKDDREKLEGFLKLHLGLKEIKLSIKEETAEIDKEIPEKLAKNLEKEIKEVIPTIKHIKFKTTNKE